MAGHFRLKYDYAAIRGLYMSGNSWTAIAVKVGQPARRWQSVYNHCRRQAIKRGDQWPWTQNPEVKKLVWSRATVARWKSVTPMIIMSMVDDYCEERGITLADFGRMELGMKSSQLSRLYAYHTGRVKMSGPRAVQILRALGEPVPERLVA